MKNLFCILGLLLLFAVTSHAQVKVFTSEFDEPTDTVTNAGTQYVQVHNPGPKNSTTIVVEVVKISGTVGGTITLQGSLDGTTWVALNQPSSQTALATITATNASANYHWWFPGNPFPRYRISYTGTGTMVATIGGKLVSR